MILLVATTACRSQCIYTRAHALPEQRPVNESGDRTCAAQRPQHKNMYNEATYSESDVKGPRLGQLICRDSGCSHWLPRQVRPMFNTARAHPFSLYPELPPLPSRWVSPSEEAPLYPPAVLAMTHMIRVEEIPGKPQALDRADATHTMDHEPLRIYGRVTFSEAALL